LKGFAFLITILYLLALSGAGLWFTREGQKKEKP
jgi:hypothetical protein